MTPTRPARRVAHLATAGILVLVATACYPDRPTTVGGDPTVTTIPAPNASFAAPTYTLVDSVVKLQEEGEIVPMPGQYDDEILAQIRENMNARGYHEITFPYTGSARPDFIVVAGVAETTYVGWYYNYYYYWGWWGGWPAYGPGYGWYYPGYAVPYAVDAGGVIIQMVDARAAAQQPDSVPVAWIASINAVLTGGDETNRIRTGIDQAFDQSPYLKASGTQ
jgi:hypothetical protein